MTLPATAGDWQTLDTDLAQLPRYQQIALWLSELDADRAVLDVGCGTATLRDYLPPHCAYTGIEQSPMAAAQARLRTPCILESPAEHASVTDRYTAVVFNEMLYYLDDPCGVIDRFRAVLTPQGVLLVSIFQKSNSSWLKRLAHWTDRRRPRSNLHCDHMVRRHLSAGRILRDGVIAQRWHVWIVRP